jgi:hypothetical protein
MQTGLHLWLRHLTASGGRGGVIKITMATITAVTFKKIMAYSVFAVAAFILKKILFFQPEISNESVYVI